MDALLAVVFAVGAVERPIDEVVVDRIELNHFVARGGDTDDDGRRVVKSSGEQLLWNFWGWYRFPDYDFHVREWLPYKKEMITRESGWYVLWVVSKSGKRLKIKSKVYIETWSNFDPERQDRDEFPESRRKRIPGLRGGERFPTADPFAPSWFNDQAHRRVIRSDSE